MKPWHYILIGIVVTALLFGAGFFVGHRYKQCPVCIDPRIMIDSMEAEVSVLRSIAEDAMRERNDAQQRIDAIEQNRPPLKTRVNETYRTLSGLPLDSVLDVLRAGNVE